MKCKEVDRATFSEHAKGDLRRDHPAVTAETPGELLDKRRVGLVEQAVQRLSIPEQSHVQPRGHRDGDHRERAKRHVLRTTQLDPRDGGSRQPGLGGKVELAPAAAAAQGAYLTA